MADPSERTKHSEIRLIHLLPNLLTIAAICAGLTAIRSGFEGNYAMAVSLILVACVLDGLDGRLARLLNCSTDVGAELDSLADFVNFGVAPVLILHSWALQDLHNTGWIAVLFYTICCVLRLARFNVSGRMEGEGAPSDFFVGVPSPAGAILVLLPMVVSFAAPDMALTPPPLVALYICLVGGLMIGQFPTYSFKNMTIDRTSAKYAMLGAGILAAALLTYFWAALALLTLAYVGCIAWGFGASRKTRVAEG